MKRIALIAGRGRLPQIFADEARRAGEFIIGIAIRGLTPPELESHVDKIYWGEPSEARRAVEIFKAEKASYVVMIGNIPKVLMFNKQVTEDKVASEIFNKSIDGKDYSIMRAIVCRLGREGVRVMDPTPYIKKLIPRKGLIAKRPPTRKEWEDIRFGYKMAKKISGLDIGQTVVIKNKVVIAVEAIEGTDAAIKRAGGLEGVGRGAVVVKVARPGQDMRLDIPTIGPESIDALIGAGCSTIAVQAGKTLVVDRDEIIKKADQAGISVVAV